MVNVLITTSKRRDDEWSGELFICYCNAPLSPTTANKLAQLWLRYFVFNMQRGGTLQTVRNYTKTLNPSFPWEPCTYINNIYFQK